MGRLRSLQHLNMSYNSFGGKIPPNISNCTELTYLGLQFNKLTGLIPDQLNSLLNLNFLTVGRNNLTGTIPSWIGNFSSLRSLYLEFNNFQGSIPNELGGLTNLGVFSLGPNNLSGTIPSSIYNISSIYAFSVTESQLHGELPQNIGITLPNLERFFGGGNNFTGGVPTSFLNASRLQKLDLGGNNLTGPLPEYLGHLQSLVFLSFGLNRLGSGKDGDLKFLNLLANCTSLKLLDLNTNHFGGELPVSIANLSTKLNELYLGGNLIHGSIPIGIENLVNLTVLGLENNFLDSRVPDAIGKLSKLVKLGLFNNNFSGPIPSSLGNLTSLTILEMRRNRFDGSIPPALGNCRILLHLDLSNNNLSGSIPKELLGLSSLSLSVRMSNNSLTGLLPSEVGSLVRVTELDLSGNKFIGEIPTTLGSCIMLQHLYLGANKFERSIPQSLKNLRSVEGIDLSHNNFSGQIPEFLGKLAFLKYLNLSQNNFEGELPKEGIFSNASGLSIFGNDRLCGGLPQLLLPPCPYIKPHSSQRALLSLNVFIPTACVLAFIVTFSFIVLARFLVKKSKATTFSSREWKSGFSYSELVQSTNGFSMKNLIGSGSFGSVYKGVVPGEGILVAVKVLNLHQHGASRSFIDECNTLRNIRHRNLLKIITACSSIDNQGNEFKSLVFEYMINGSLDSWLHATEEEQSQSKLLSMIQRLNIAIDVASALEYLHHRCETSIVHCDLKPSNVLLDEDMVGHVGDFGLARFIMEASDHPSQSQALSAGLKGTIGYIPPEYGMGSQVSIRGDIYSYGILLLEIFTGKRPTDGMFGESLSIHQFTALAIPHHVMDIVDPSVITKNKDGDDEAVQARRVEECLVSVLQIGLSCSATLPGDRLLMEVIVSKMKAIRDTYLNVRRRS